MPIYEYICHETGDLIELLRPMSAADDPVVDPTGKGRVFVRQSSTFAMAGGNTRAAGAKTASLPQGGCCPCGKNRGACSGG